jgi:hypothetical protein
MLKSLVSLSFLLSITIAYPFEDSSICPSNSSTACPEGTTCCSQMFSTTGYGCCNLPNAVCCGLQGCCPEGYTCQNTPPWSSACVKNNITSSATQVCTPGALHPANYSSLPSMIVIGDSVSIGYVGPVTNLLNSTIFVQHSPASGGGGADDVGNGVNCEQNFLRDSMYNPQAWDMISFNFGLHNLDNSSSAEQNYATLLANFTDTLIANQPNAKLIYVTTTPFMPDLTQGNHVVEDLNNIAINIMNQRKIPVADLYHHVTAFCGDIYYNCSICDDEWNNVTKTTCGYHYNPTGWEYLAEFLAPIFTKLWNGELDTN